MIETDALRDEEKAQWLELWRGYQAFYRVTIPDAVTDLTWRRLLDPAEPVLGFGARSGGRLLGIAHAVLHRSCWTAGDYCYLQDLFTVPEARGRGVGRALIHTLAAAAAARGASRVIWLTHESNTTAMRLYDGIADRTGMVQYRLRSGPGS